jgi:hypothetical protein
MSHRNLIDDLINQTARTIRRWWDSLLLPPKPSDFFGVVLEDKMHTKKLVLALPAMRDDESAYLPKIVSRQLIYQIGDPSISTPISVSIGTDATQYEIGGIPNNSHVNVSLVNVTENGWTSEPTIRSFDAPSPVPQPSDFTGSWEEEPDVPTP